MKIWAITMIILSIALMGLGAWHGELLLVAVWMVVLALNVTLLLDEL